MSLRMYKFTCQRCNEEWEEVVEVRLEKGIPMEFKEIPKCETCGTLGTPDLSFIGRAGGALNCKHLSWSIFHIAD